MILAGIASVWAQAPATFRSSVELAVIPCSVVDARGKAVSGLTRDDFRVYDNGRRRIIESFWPDSDEPITLGFLIDASDSQETQVAEHRATAYEILSRLLRPGDRAFVLTVAEDIRLAVDWTDSLAIIHDRIAAKGSLFEEACPNYSCGSSPLWNAIHEAARLKLRPLKGAKALLILTDGFDSGSTFTWKQAADEVHQADASVYAVQYRSALGGRYAPDLYRLAEEAGGTTFEASTGTNAIVSRLQTDLRHRYVIGFRPEKSSGQVRHEVRVEATRPDLTVRARKTYFRD